MHGSDVKRVAVGWR